MNKSSRFGAVRARISGVACFSGMRYATSHVMPITPAMLNARTTADRFPNFPSPNRSASPAERMGFISGEISIAPMMTAALFSSSPKRAIRLARMRRATYSGPTRLEFRTES